MASENGWEPSHAPTEMLEWVIVPGTDPPVHLQVLKGWPRAIMPAYAADYHAYVEPLRDHDSASFTPTNAVATSNHLNGTAMDLNWELHPFRVANAGYSPQMIATMEELLDFYEDTMFWANNWDSPKDAMHHQMGYGSFNNPHTGDFIARKIRPDGFSTFRRSGIPAAPLPPLVVPAPRPPVLSRADGYALAIMAEGWRLKITPRGIVIALATALVETDLTMYANSNDPPSLLLPHDKVGSDHMSSGLFQQQPWWGPLTDRMDPTRSATIFFTVDKGHGTRGLTKIRDGNNQVYDYNDTSRSPGFYAQKVQGSAFPDRYDGRMAEAQNIYNRLSGMTPPPPTGDGFLMALSEQEQRDLYNAVMRQRPSLSPLREPDEGTQDPIGNSTDVQWFMDSSVHILVVWLLASIGHPGQTALLQRVASMDPVKYPDRQADAQLAQALLAEAADNLDIKKGILKALGNIAVAAPAATAVVQTWTPPPAPQPVAEPEVLPAVRETTVVVRPPGNSPDDLLDTMDRLHLFQQEFTRRFDILTGSNDKGDHAQ